MLKVQPIDQCGRTITRYFFHPESDLKVISMDSVTPKT